MAGCAVGEKIRYTIQFDKNFNAVLSDFAAKKGMTVNKAIEMIVADSFLRQKEELNYSELKEHVVENNKATFELLEALAENLETIEKNTGAFRKDFANFINRPEIQVSLRKLQQ